MFNIFGKKDKNAEIVRNLLRTLWYPPLMPFDDPIIYSELKMNTKSKVLLFSYGIIDAFSQGSKLSKQEFIELLKQVDSYFVKELGNSLVKFINSKNFKEAFDDEKLRRIIMDGGTTYNDFASKDPRKGGFALRRLNSFISFWEMEK